MQAKAVKALGVLLLMGGLSYGVYEGVKISPTSYMYNSISDISLMEGLDISPSTTEETPTVYDGEKLVNSPKTKDGQDQAIVTPASGDATASEPAAAPSPEPSLQPSVGTDPVVSTKTEQKSESTDGPKQVEQSTNDVSDNSQTSTSVTPQTENQNAPKSPQDTAASSHGLTKVTDYNAATKADVYTDNNSSASRPTTYVEGENPEYIKNLWSNSIAIKHRQYWNLSAIGDPSWERQVAFVKKRFNNHAYYYDKEIMYGMVFGDFTINQAKATGKKFEWEKYNSNSKRAIYELNAENLANMCYYNMARTPWGTWWGGGRYRFWALMWDFCSKESVRKDGTPENYWYHNKGDRSEAIYNKQLEVNEQTQIAKSS